MTNENPAPAVTQESLRKSQLTIITNCMKFHPGQIFATPGAIALMQQRCFDLLQLLARHVHGDWSECHPDDAALNFQALLCGSRLMSVYRLSTPEVLTSTPREQQRDLPTVWVISDATLSEKDDPLVRNVTTFLLPSEY